MLTPMVGGAPLGSFFGRWRVWVVLVGAVWLVGVWVCFFGWLVALAPPTLGAFQSARDWPNSLLELPASLPDGS